MPNNTNERKGKQAGELSAEERFRNFFSTSVIDLPEEMTRRTSLPRWRKSPRPGCWASCSATTRKRRPPRHSLCWRSPPARSCWGQMQSRYSRSRRTWRWNCVPQTLFRQCRCSPPAQSLPRQFRQSRCLHPRRLLPCSRSRKSPRPSRCRSLLQPPKSSLRRRTPRRRCCRRRNWSSGRCSS